MAGIFSRFIFNNAIFNTDGDTPVVNETKGGANYKEYERYAKRLRRLAKAADRFNDKKYLKEITKTAEQVPVIDVAGPLLEEIAKAYQEAQAQEVANSIRLQIEKMLYKIQLLAYEQEREAEEEMVILLCI